MFEFSCNKNQSEKFVQKLNENENVTCSGSASFQTFLRCFQRKSTTLTVANFFVSATWSVHFLCTFVCTFSTTWYRGRFRGNQVVAGSSPCISQKIFRAFAKPDETEGSNFSALWDYHPKNFCCPQRVLLQFPPCEILDRLDIQKAQKVCPPFTNFGIVRRFKMNIFVLKLAHWSRLHKIDDPSTLHKTIQFEKHRLVGLLWSQNKIEDYQVFTSVGEYLSE